MRINNPIILEDEVERFIAYNANVEIGNGIYYYTGTNNTQAFIHTHSTGDKLGESIFLDKGLQEIEAVHVLIDLLIEGMGTKVDVEGEVYHKADCDGYTIFVGHAGERANLAIFATGYPTEATVISLPYNRTGLTVAHNLLTQLKPKGV